MIQFIDRRQVQDEKWNKVVRSSPRFRHYALTYFLDAVSPGWMALVKGNYEWVWPVPVKRWPCPQAYQPLLAQQLGPYFQNDFSPEDFLIGWKILRKRYWRVSLKFNDCFDALPVATIPHINIELDLNRTYAELAGGYNRTAQSNLKKAQKTTLKITVGVEFRPEIVEHFRKGRGSAVKVLDSVFYGQVAAVYAAFARHGEAETWVATQSGHFLAGVMLLKAEDRLLNFFTGQTQDSREVGAMCAVFDAVIRHYADSSKVLDFEGSNDSGVAQFYKSFGGVERLYLQAETDWLPPWINRFLY